MVSSPVWCLSIAVHCARNRYHQSSILCNPTPFISQASPWYKGYLLSSKEQHCCLLCSSSVRFPHLHSVLSSAVLCLLPSACAAVCFVQRLVHSRELLSQHAAAALVSRQSVALLNSPHFALIFTPLIDCCVC